MKQVEATGKSVNAAIENGLAMLGLTLCDVDVEILQQKGLFRPAKVRLTVSAEGEETLKNAFTAEVKEAEPAKKEAKPVKKEAPVKQEEKTQNAREDKKRVKEAKPAKAEPVAEKKPCEKAPVEEKKTAQPVSPVEPTRKVKPVSPEQVALAEQYLGKLLSLMKIDAKIETNTADGNINIDIVTADGGVIGHRGEVLDALSVLTKRAVEEGDDKYVHVFVDSNGYRNKREQSLEALANRMAAKCERTGRKVVLEPMSSNHRKIIHATLSNNDKVFTKSEGDEPNRHVVIMLKRRPQIKK